MTVRKNDFNINVTSGVGQNIEFDEVAPWFITLIGIKAPSVIAEYDLQIYDDVGILLYAENDLVGNSSISLERVCKSTLLIKISGASVDGDYFMRVYCSLRS